MNSLSSFSESIRHQIKVLIVDDASHPKLAAEKFIEARSWIRLNISLYRISPRKNWNIGGARNLAFSLVNGNILLLDVDTFVDERFLTEVLKMHEQLGYLGGITKFNRKMHTGALKPHPAVMLTSSSVFWQVGGCDEDFVGHYGQTDVHFFARVSMHPRIRRHDRMDLVLTQENLSPCESIKNVPCDLKWITIDSRDPRHNKQLFEWKKKSNCWSNSFLRFEWWLVSSNSLG